MVLNLQSIYSPRFTLYKHGNFKKRIFFLETRNTFTNGHIYVGAINIINCYVIIWKRGSIFWPSLFSKFAFVLWDFKQIPRRTGKQRLDLRIHTTIIYFDNRHFLDLRRMQKPIILNKLSLLVFLISQREMIMTGWKQIAMFCPNCIRDSGVFCGKF